MTMKKDDITTLSKFAKKIVDKKVTVIAIFLLESTKYISFIAGQTLIFLGPILTMFVNDKKYYQLINLLEDKENVEFLISEIEDLHFKINK